LQRGGSFPVNRAADDADILKSVNVAGAMPRSLVHHHNDPVVLKMLRAFLEKDFHCISICIGKDKRAGLTVVRAYGTEYMRIFSDDMDMSGYNGPYSFWRPAVSRIRYPSEPTLILKEEFYWPGTIKKVLTSLFVLNYKNNQVILARTSLIKTLHRGIVDMRRRRRSVS